MSNPLVSVVVPVYNAEKTVARCLESICGQTYPELEIIAVNDGSADGSLAVCRQFAAQDARIRVVDKPSSGVSDTRNCGLDLAHGKYIQFADSDDWLLPDLTTQLVEAAERSGAELVAAPFRMVVPRADAASDGSAFDQREYSLLPVGVYGKTDWLRQNIRYPSSFYFGALWNKLYRRDLLEENSIRFPQVFYAEDQQFNLLCLQAAETFAAIDYAGYCYLQNPESVCHTRVKTADMLAHRKRMYRDYRELCIQLGIYSEMKLPLCRIYLSLFESPLPNGALQKLSDTVTHTPAREI